MPDRVLLVMAEEAGGTPVAGALNLIGSNCLFGRNWGCEWGLHVKFLHFELCYYQVIAHPASMLISCITFSQTNYFLSCTCSFKSVGPHLHRSGASCPHLGVGRGCTQLRNKPCAPLSNAEQVVEMRSFAFGSRAQLVTYILRTAIRPDTCS